MCYIISIKQVVTALLIHQHTGTILAAVIYTYIKDHLIVHNTISIAAVHADTNARIKREIIVIDHSIIAFTHHQSVLPAGNFTIINDGKIAMTHIDSRSIS